MPGFLLLDDAQKLVTQRLQDHANGLFSSVPQIQVPSIDPGEIIGRLQQHGQDALTAVQQAPQALQPLQVDAGDVVQRLQQHGQDALDALQPIGEGLQNVVQPVVQQVQETAENVTQGAQGLVQGAQQAVIERGGDLRQYARQAAQNAGIDPDIFERQIQQESGFNPTAKSPAGAQGIAQFMPATAAGMGVDPSDPYASLDGAARLMANQLRQYGGDYAKALAAYNAGPGAVQQYGGVPPFEETQRYVSTILGGAKQAVGDVIQGAKQVTSNLLPGVSQFGDAQLSNAEAYAACGPAAAVRFAQKMGRNPTLREATDLAKTVGWSIGQGMAGLQSESKLFDLMQIPHRVLGADWQAFAREAQTGNPVTLSTPGHYFTADAYDPASGAFHVGRSGLDLSGGSEWMTPAQMEQRMGSLQGGLVADNPQTPSASPLSAPSSAVQAPQELQGARQVGAGLQSLDRSIQDISSQQRKASIEEPRPLGVLEPGGAVGQAFSGLGSAASNLIADTRGPQTAAQQPTPSDVLTNPLGRGNVLEQPTAALTGQPAGETSPRQGPSVLPSLDQVQEALRRGDLQGAQDALGQAREAVATSAAGPVLGALRGPALLSDQEVLATPQAQIARNFLRAAGGPEPTDQEVAEGARGLLTGQAVAGAHTTPGATRMYHGTSADFPRPEPEWLQSPENLYGPGYYLTSDPRVAGGLVSRGGEQVGPDWLRSSARRQEGAVIQPGYAIGEGANVRPVDVPRDLKLLNIEAYIPPADREAIRQALPEARRAVFDRQASRAFEDRPTGQQIYDALTAAYGRTVDAKPAANRVLADAGFDGIKHEGGRILPMADEAGRAIAHDVNVIFPESLDKIRNALSGTQGGRIRTDFAAGLGGAAAIGAGALSLSGFKAPDLADTSGPQTAAQQPIPSDVLTNPLGSGNALEQPSARLTGQPGGGIAPATGPAVLPALDQAQQALRSGDIQGAQDALGQAREAIATSAVGPALGALRGPELLSDEEVLRSREAVTARDMLEQMNAADVAKGRTPQPISDADVADAARSLMTGQAVAMTGEGFGRPSTTAPRAAPPSSTIDYDALAQMRRDARRAAAQPPPRPAPGSPEYQDWLLDRGKWAPPAAAEDSRLNKEIAASVNNMFAVPSMVTNGIGGAIETIKRPAVTAFTGDLGAAGADLRAMGLGLGDALADMGTAFRTGIRPSAAAAAETVGKEAYHGQDILNVKGSGAWRIAFLRAMGATDEFMRSLNSAGAQASEMARLMKAYPDLSQSELISRFGDNLMGAGEKAAAESVYATGGTGIGRRMSEWRNLLTKPDATVGERALGLMTNVLVPFSNIPDVILTKGIQRLPIANELTMVAQLHSKDPLVRQRALTSAALAEAINLGIFAQVQQGNITGNGPSDPAKKAALQNARDQNGDPIWQPNSVRIGGRWLPYASLGPVALRMGAIANAAEQISDEMSKPNPSEDTLQRIASTALAALDGTSETVADAWYLQTVGRVFNAMKNGGVGPALGQTALSTAQRAIPFGGELRSIEQAASPTVSEPRNPIEAIAAQIPGLSQFATPKIDPTTGRPLERPADLGSLLVRSPGAGEPTPIDTALAAHNLGVGDAPSTITQRDYTVSITPDEQRQYTIDAGQRIERNVQALLDNPRWSSQTQEQQRDALQKAIDAARADAAAVVWRSIPPSDLNRRVEAARARKAQQAEPVFRSPVTTP